MTTVIISSQAQRCQYQSDGLLTGELFASNSILGRHIFSWTFQSIDGFSDAAVERYLQFFNGAPATFNLVKSIRVPAAATFSWCPPGGWGVFATTLVWWAVSDTPDTYTASADGFWVNAQFTVALNRIA